MGNIILNELSLNKTCTDSDHFKDVLKNAFPTLNIMQELEIVLIKATNIYSVVVYMEQGNNIYLSDLLKNNDDEFLLFKNYLINILEDPYITEDIELQVDGATFAEHSIIFSKDSGINYSIYKKYPIFSFDIIPFNTCTYFEYSNGTIENIYNLDTFNIYYSFLEKITEEYILQLFKKNEESTVDFSSLDSKRGFSNLSNDDRMIFFKKLLDISKMKLEEIKIDSSLKYKKFNSPEFIHQKYKGKNNIFKLRITQKYRCMGIELNSKFYPIYFETDHKLSDKA